MKIMLWASLWGLFIYLSFLAPTATKEEVDSFFFSPLFLFKKEEENQTFFFFFFFFPEHGFRSLFDLGIGTWSTTGGHQTSTPCVEFEVASRQESRKSRSTREIHQHHKSL
jgi:hypothetical protein